MLTQIHIKNFAIIDNLDLDFSTAFTVLTGETGAGKSIIVDALGLALGDRADSHVVRKGASRAEITITFDISGLGAAQRWLKERDMDTDNECMMRRVVTAEGRSRGYINGSSVPMQMLRGLGELLVDIHGQHEHQSLQKREVQRQLLDDFAGLTETTDRVNKIYDQWRALQTDLDGLKQTSTDRQERIELLQFQIGELEALGLEKKEARQLEEEHQRLVHAEKLLTAAMETISLLHENDNSAIVNALGRQLNQLVKLRDIDPAITPSCEILENALIQLDEATSELRQYTNQLEVDPQRIDWVEQRLSAIHTLSRKHRVDPGKLHALRSDLEAELITLSSTDKQLADIRDTLQRLKTTFFHAAEDLSIKRKEAASRLTKKIQRIIHQLGMPGGRFEIAFIPVEAGKLAPHGLEHIEFLVSANPGHPPAPLNKVASGGELSRISLAIQVVAANRGQIPTFVFDEIDSGVGGRTAETIGRQLRALGQTHQVLCVTHLAQVAALGHHHFTVTKQSRRNTTTIGIATLDGSARSDEIARMLGGVEITKQTRAHAKEMLARGQSLATQTAGQL